MLVKLSYSILSTWAIGRWENAVAMYLGREIPITPAMELGRIKHEIWEKYINKYKQMPSDLGGKLFKLGSPITEQKYEKVFKFSDDIDILLRGVPDMTDNDKIYEFKCGLTKPSNYLSRLQLDYYKLLLPEAREGYYYCYNPYTNTYKIGVKFLDDNNAEQALNHLLSNAGEMIDYLKTEKLLKNYKRSRGNGRH